MNHRGICGPKCASNYVKGNEEKKKIHLRNISPFRSPGILSLSAFPGPQDCGFLFSHPRRQVSHILNFELVPQFPLLVATLTVSGAFSIQIFKRIAFSSPTTLSQQSIINCASQETRRSSSSRLWKTKSISKLGHICWQLEFRKCPTLRGLSVPSNPL